VLEGSIRRAGNRVRITAQLTRLMQRFDEFAHGCAGFG
jgi:TolB-like protein